MPETEFALGSRHCRFAPTRSVHASAAGRGRLAGSACDTSPNGVDGAVPAERGGMRGGEPEATREGNVPEATRGDEPGGPLGCGTGSAGRFEIP